MSFTEPELWVPEFGYYAGRWRVGEHVRDFGDVNGDKLRDLVGFGDNGVQVAPNRSGIGFRFPKLWIHAFGYHEGDWVNSIHYRYLADVNEDGLADIVGFGTDGTIVSLSKGNTFGIPKRVIAEFGLKQGWVGDQHPRFVGDANGDGLLDLIGFGKDGVYVSLNHSNGVFAPAKQWVAGFGSDAGWDSDGDVRFVQDISGDGRADLIGFDQDGVTVSLSQAKSFTEPRVWVHGYGSGEKVGSWDFDEHPRFIADANGDGLQDVVGFAADGVYVSLNNTNGFSTPFKWSDHFDDDDGWSTALTYRLLADVNADGKDDVVGFGADGVEVALSTGLGFEEPKLVLESFGFDDEAGSWRVNHNPRVLVDVNGDLNKDIVGFGNDGVFVSLSKAGASINIPFDKGADEVKEAVDGDFADANPFTTSLESLTALMAASEFSDPAEAWAEFDASCDDSLLAAATGDEWSAELTDALLASPLV